jgi:hypothetical protein
MLTAEEKADASDLASMWQSSKFRNATVQIFVHDETDHDGRPTYEFLIRGLGRLPKLKPAHSSPASQPGWKSSTAQSSEEAALGEAE